MGDGAEQALLQVAAKSIGNGQGDYQRSHSGGDADDRDGGNDRQHRFAASGLQVAQRNPELERHAFILVQSLRCKVQRLARD